MKAKLNFINIFAYITGKYRYFIFYRPLLRKYLMRSHIEEQIIWRISIMDEECYNNGSCKICGCETVALQMANKACDKPCYPEMKSAEEWIKFSTLNKLEYHLDSSHRITGKQVWEAGVKLRKEKELIDKINNR